MSINGAIINSNTESVIADLVITTNSSQPSIAVQPETTTAKLLVVKGVS
jgi:hypothetical protein